MPTEACQGKPFFELTTTSRAAAVSRETIPVATSCPWSIRMLALGELDAWCADAGLDLVDRHADWSGTPATGDDAVTVSVYRRA